MARVKFIRDEEPNIRSLENNSGVIDGALYVATDTGSMWMGTDSNALLKISDPITINLNNTTTKVTQEQYDTISASWPNVKLQVNSSVYHPSYIVTDAFYFAEASNSVKTSNLSFPQVSIIYINSNLSIGKRSTSLNIADPRSNYGYGIMKSDASTIETSTSGVISIKNSGITSAKIADGAVTKAKLGSDVVIPTSKTDIGLENVDNTADADKSVKYATSAGSANTASVANSVAWDNVTGAPTIPNIDTDSFVLHESINEYTAPDNKLNVELISGLDSYISTNPALRATQSQAGTIYSEISAQGPVLGRVYSRPSIGLILGTIESNAIKETNLTDGCVSKSKLSSDVPVIYSSTSEPTSTDGKDGDVWIVYEA